MRHPLAGSAYVASKNATIPVINAGDGSHSHPTQTLADLCTIRRHKHKFDGLTVGFCGDLKYGRTVHSLIQALSRYTGIKIVLISPKELKLPEYVKYETIKANGMEYYETESMTEVIGELDVLYMTRIQHERFASEEEYLRLKDSYVLDTAKMDLAKDDLIVLHPLPRVNEISTAVDKDPRACYFEQVLNAKYMRMALILKLLAEKDCESPAEDVECITDLVCENKGCIVTTEQELPHLFRKGADGKYRCLYCEHRE
jgi:aspartate carbamoyltransferase catalytic subunit